MSDAYERLTHKKSPYALPPPSAWRNPDLWLEDDGLTIREDAPKFMPELNEDGVVQPFETVQKVLSLFREDYEWPLNRRHPELFDDIHHFQFHYEDYRPEYHDGSTLPMRFRNLPILTGRMPRQLHNVIHDTTLPPPMPSYGVMLDYSHHFHHLADLHESAHNTVEARRSFAVRRADIERNPERLGNRTEDTIGKYVLSLIHNRHFVVYQERISEHQEQDVHPVLIDYVNYGLLEAKKPHVIRKALHPLGQIAADKTINFLPKLPLRAA